MFAACQAIREIGTINDNTAQTHRLNEIIQEVHAPPLLSFKLAHLARLTRNGTASVQWWDALGRDCQIADSTDIEGLHALLAEKCRKVSQKLLQDAHLTDPSLIGALHLFDRACAAVASPLESAKRSSPVATSQMLDRTDETYTVQEFLDHPQQAMLIVVGLDGIGKTLVVDHAVSQTGRQLHRLAIASDTSLDFIGEWILRCFSVGDRPPSGKPSDAILGDWLAQHVKRDNIIVIEKGQLLLSHGIWREKAAPEFLVGLALCLQNQKCKLIIESSFQFDLPSADPSSVRRYRIGGLPSEPGILLLDQHLRRSGVDPDNYDKKQRTEVVNRLGGHPFALIIASEYVEQKGMAPVISELRNRKGVHYEIVRRVLRDLELSHEEKTVLSLLALARSPIRAETLAEVVTFDPLPAIRRLIQLSFIERSKNDNIQIVSLLSSSFADF